MIKLLIGLLRYKNVNKKLYREDLSKYPEGMTALYDTLKFMGKDMQDNIWGTFIMFISYF